MNADDRILAGRYRLIAPIGRGGMSVVYRAYDDVLDRPVAVKLLASIDDPIRREQLRDEARACGRLNHRHIAQIYDYGESEPGTPYLVMELVDGRTLAEVLDAGPLPWREAVAVASQVASALRMAHRRGLVHRDIKPENIVMTDEGPKIIDFGISAVVGDADARDDGRIVGTAAYVAPERITDVPVGAAFDMYSLGIVLYRMLAGRLPWPVTSSEELLRAHLFTAPEPLPAIDGLPADVAATCMACLSKDPYARPTAETFDSALGVASAPARARERTSPAAPTTRTMTMPFVARPVPSSEAILRRRWPLAAVAALLLVAALVVWQPWSSGDGSVPAAAATVRCAAGFTLEQDSGSAFTATLAVTNTGGAAATNWLASFAFPATQTISPGRVTVRSGGGEEDVVLDQQGRTVTARSADGDTLAAGQQITIPLHGTYHGANPLPTAFRLNDGACQPQLTIARGATSPPARPVGGDNGHGHNGDGGGKGGGKGKANGQDG